MVVDFYLYGHFQHIDGRHNPLAVGRADFRANLRHLLVRVCIVIALVAQTAHQPSAKTVDFCRIERKPLRLCHLDGHALELGHVACAAANSAAGRKAAKVFRFIPGTHLSKLNAVVEGGCKVFYKLSKIYARSRCKVEHDFRSVKGVFAVHELHFQIMRRNFFTAGLHRLRLFRFRRRVKILILLRCNADNRFQWLYHFFFGYFPFGVGNPSVFQPLCRFYNDGHIPLVNVPYLRSKIIELAAVFELDNNNFYHIFRFVLIFLILSARAPYKARYSAQSWR